MSKETEIQRRGMQTRREVMGDAHVDRAEESTTEFDAPFQRFIAEGAWGRVWSGDGLTRRERSMLAIALLAAAGRLEELELHIRATRRTGASASDVREALMHVAVYAGVPAANAAFACAKKVLAEMEAEQ